MMELTRSNRESLNDGPGGLGDIFPGAGSPGLATVSHGPYAERLPVAGMSVGDIRQRFTDRFDIDPNSTAILDGQPVGPATIVLSGQTLLFTRRAGEKGRLWTPAPRLHH